MERLINTLKSFTDLHFNIHNLIEKTNTLQIKKNTILLSVGQTQELVYFITEGVIRSYTVVEEKEYTSSFFSKGDFALSLESYLLGIPSVEFLETCSKVSLVSFKIRDYADMFIDLPYKQQSINHLATKGIVCNKARLFELTTSTAYQRYNNFRKNNQYVNDIISRKHLASYLGISNEFLSRLERRYQDEQYHNFTKTRHH